MDYITIDVQYKTLLGSKGGPRRKSKSSVFIAYRMNDQHSRDMRARLEASIRDIDPEVRVFDGKVLHGQPWAEEVRRRIDRCKLLILDVTGPSPDIMFEFGFAGNKPFIPMVQRQEDRDRLPTWLTVFQMPAFGETSMQILAADIVTALRTVLPKSSAYRRPPAVPGMIVWLQKRGSTIFDDQFERFANRAQQYSLNVERVDPRDLPSFDDLRSLMRAWLVVACMDGGPTDQAGHFFLGDIAGRRRAGSGAGPGQSVNRRGIALVSREQDVPVVVADSVRRVGSKTLTTVTADNMLKVTEQLMISYRRWIMREVDDL